MAKYYCIKVIKKDGTRGYISKGEKEFTFEISTSWNIEKVLKFKNHTDANYFIKKYKIQNNRDKAYIRDDQDLEKDIPVNSKITILGKENETAL